MRAFSFAASALTIGFLATAAPAGTWTGPWTGFDAAETERTCKHYGNRARFRHEGAKVAFEAMLADSCYTALRQMTGFTVDSPYKARKSRNFLDRLTEFKKTIISMNTDAFRRSKPALRSLERAPSGGGSFVTDAGEYLIARQIGLFAAWSDWADTTNVEVASADQVLNRK